MRSWGVRDSMNGNRRAHNEWCTGEASISGLDDNSIVDYIIFHPLFDRRFSDSMLHEIIHSRSPVFS